MIPCIYDFVVVIYSLWMILRCLYGILLLFPLLLHAILFRVFLLMDEGLCSTKHFYDC